MPWHASFIVALVGMVFLARGLAKFSSARPSRLRPVGVARQIGNGKVMAGSKSHH